MLCVFLFCLPLVLGRLLLLGRPGLGGGHIPAVSEELVQQGEGSGLAVDFILVPVRIVPLAEHAAHLVAEHIQVLLGNAHLLHRLVNLRNPQTPGALQAVALIEGHAVFHLGDKHHRDILFAFAAHFRLHFLHSLPKEQYPFGAVYHKPPKKGKTNYKQC